MATSITERISGDLACALADVGHGQALLEQAESHDLFLRRLDEEREWFCYHHLFAEFLLRRLERDQPERIVRLHATASRWFAEHHLMREAVDHAIAAGEDERAVETDGTARHRADPARARCRRCWRWFPSCRRTSWPAVPDCSSWPHGRTCCCSGRQPRCRAGCVRIRRRKARALRVRSFAPCGWRRTSSARSWSATPTTPRASTSWCPNAFRDRRHWPPMWSHPPHLSRRSSRSTGLISTPPAGGRTGRIPTIDAPMVHSP